MQITQPLKQSITREPTTRANRSPPERLAAEFIRGLKKDKQTVLPERIPIQAQPQEPNYAEMSEEELVRIYFADLGQPLTPEEWRLSQIRMKELEKLPHEELLRRHKEALGDLF